MASSVSIWRSTKGFTVLAIFTAAVEVGLLFGFPTLSDARWYLFFGFCAFVGFIGRALFLEHEKVLELTEPPFTFLASYSSTKQRINGSFGLCRRISVTNDSDAVAKDCQLVLASCSADIPGLTPDTPLPVKDGEGVRKTDINRGDTKHFDVFYTLLTGLIGTEDERPSRTIVCTPNQPEVERWGESQETIVFRLVGSNFEPRIWKAVVLIGNCDARITRLEPLASEA